MNKIDPRLNKFTIALKDSIRELKTKEIQTSDNVVLNLWPEYTLNEILKNKLFYEQPITQPSTMTKQQHLHALKINNVFPEIINSISLVNIDYRGFDNKIYQGQVDIHNDLVPSIKRIFKKILLETDFPITSIFPICMFNWNNSSRLNNCGIFDWRFVEKRNEISDHTLGASIDVNPVINPWVRKGLPNSPNFPYDPTKRGALHVNSKVVRIFKEEGWKWGGDWKNSKDWMHFYRPDIFQKYYGKIEVEE